MLSNFEYVTFYVRSLGGGVRGGFRDPAHMYVNSQIPTEDSGGVRETQGQKSKQL